MAKKAERAFIWLVKILRRGNVRFRISGGLAARIYGSKRPLKDIDFEISECCFSRILPIVKGYAIFGPGRYVDKSFDLQLLTLRYCGQEMDVFGCESQKLFHKKKRRWVDSPTAVSCAVRKKVFGLVVPVITKSALMRYKRMIGRRVDLLDLEALDD